MRGPDVSVVPDDNTLRVVVTGASETFGLYEPSDREYPRQLEDSLRARIQSTCDSGTPHRVEVVNAALPGMALPSLARHLDYAVRPLRPQVVVLYPSPGFYLNIRPPSAQVRAPSDTALSIANARKLRVGERLMSQLKALAPTPMLTAARRFMINRTMKKFPDGIKYEAIPPDRLKQFENDLRTTIGVARSLGAHVILMGHVNLTMEPDFDDEALLVSWENQLPRATGETIARFHAAARDIEERAAADSNVNFVDLPEAFAGRWDGSFADFVHFTESGASVVAGALTPPVLAASRACGEAGAHK
jgi:lysophospholipase L1-like esterase